MPDANRSGRSGLNLSPSLFPDMAHAGPSGFVHRPDFVGAGEEEVLLAAVSGLAFSAFRTLQRR